MNSVAWSHNPCEMNHYCAPSFYSISSDDSRKAEDSLVFISQMRKLRFTKREELN